MKEDEKIVNDVIQKPVEVSIRSTDESDKDDKTQFNNLISREQYRRMKGMSRREFTDFLFDLYKSIYENREKQSEPDYEMIRNEVLKIRGIGDVKADQIVEAVRHCLENKEGDS